MKSNVIDIKSRARLKREAQTDYTEFNKACEKGNVMLALLVSAPIATLFILMIIFMLAMR